MTAPTITLQELRRAVCRELRMPFFRRIGASSFCTAGSTATKIYDTGSLTQPDKYWNNSFVYWIDTQKSSLINAFNANEKALLLEKSVGETPTTGDEYEIHSIWNAEDIHESINRAIKSSRQSFFTTTIDQSKCWKEDVLEYDISGLSVTPWILDKIYMELPQNDIQFTPVSGGATSVTAPAGVDLTSVKAGWIVSNFAGKGGGEVQTVTSVTNQVIATSTWTTAMDSTSRCMVFDPTESSWYPVHNFHTDALEYPQYIRLSLRNPDFYGGRFKLEYLGVSAELSEEDSTTIIPEEYLINKVCSLLHGQVLNGTKSDKESHYAEFKRYQEEADSYLVRNAPHAPGIFIKNPNAHVNSQGRDRNDPLNWNIF
jgi:hypothetical protein